MENQDISDLFSEEDYKQFRNDAAENLSLLEDSLLQLEQTPEDMELIGRVFRAMHTIKGTAGMYGYDEAAQFTHGVENYFDRLRNGELTLTKEVIDLTLAATDQLRALLSEGGAEPDMDEVARVRTAFQMLSPQTDSAQEEEEESPEADEEDVCIYNIRFRFPDDKPVLASATNPLIYLNSLSELGRCTVTCHMDKVPHLDQLEDGACHFYWDVLLGTKACALDIRTEFIFIEDELEELVIRQIEVNEDVKPLKLGEILMERGDVPRENIDQILEGQSPIGKLLVDNGETSPTHVRSALAEQQLSRDCMVQKKQEIAISSVRVPSDKLDDLVNQVGELVIAQARLQQVVSDHVGDLDLSSVSEDITRMTENLRNSTMNIRMLPIGTIFSRFNRLVRDLSKELGKDVALVTSGAETELDKTVIEHLNDPLVHIIRNSIDHGIEGPDARQKAGKPAKGNIHLAAIHSGANVLIRIEDDGCGLDVEKIRAKAIERGMIKEETEISEKELFGMLFAPGFSTAKEVTNVSGRGVGMDVVKKSIESLRGALELQSKYGQGTTLTIKLPLTLAIIDGFLVQSAGRKYVLPLSSVRECVKLKWEDVEKAHGRKIINIRNAIVPYIRLRELFGFDGERQREEQVVITEVDSKRLGMVVDRVIGQNQVVIKSLGEEFQNVTEFSGATILGDGKVVPVLDVARITELVRVGHVAA